jgi:hypothetical protein
MMMQERELYRGILDLSPTGIVIINSNKEILYNNNLVYKFLKATKENLVEKVLQLGQTFTLDNYYDNNHDAAAAAAGGGGGDGGLAAGFT